MLASILSSSSLICSSVSLILLRIPYSVFFTSVIALFISVCLFFISPSSLLNISYIFSIHTCIIFPRFWIIFTIIILNTSWGRLLISTSLSYSSGVFFLFTWNTLLCYLILCNFMWLHFLFQRLQGCSSSCFWCLPSWWVSLTWEACADFLVEGTGACPLTDGAGSCPSGE